MRLEGGLVILAAILSLSLAEHDNNATADEELQEQPVANRRRLLLGGDVTDDRDGVATADVIDDDRFTAPSGDDERPRSPPNRRRRKRKRRPQYDDYDVAASERHAGGRDRPAATDDDLELRQTTLQEEPAAHSDQARFDDLPRYRTRTYRTEDGRPLRRRRKNRRRPQLETPDGLGVESTPRREQIDDAEEERRGEKGEATESNREDIPLGSLRSEPRGNEREESPQEEAVPEHDERHDETKGDEMNPAEGTGAVEEAPAEELLFPGPRAPENVEATTTKRPRRRRLRPRVRQQVKDTTTASTDVATETRKPDEDEEKHTTDKTETALNVDTALPLAPIKISLSDLLREKNISLADILKDATEDVATNPPPRLTTRAKQLVRPKLTQLSRVNQFTQQPKQTANTQHQAGETTTVKVTTVETPTQEKASETKVSESKSTESKVYGARVPMLSMQETEDIDPIKMTDKSAVKTTNNSKAAEFLKSRIRLPPTGVYFPSVKLAKGLRSGASVVTSIDQDAVPSIDSGAIQQPTDATHKQAKTTTPVFRPETKQDDVKVAVYVANPKFSKVLRPNESLPPTETNLIPVPDLDLALISQLLKTASKSSSKVNTKADAESVRLGSESNTEVNNLSLELSTEENKRGSSEHVKVATEKDAEPMRLNIPITEPEPQVDSSEAAAEYSKSAEDEIVELLMAENGSGRLSRILAARNMTLSDLIVHRERGASQQRISDIFLSNVDGNTTSVTRHDVAKLEELFEVDVHRVRKEQADVDDVAKRVPRVLITTAVPQMSDVQDEGQDKDQDEGRDKDQDKGRDKDQDEGEDKDQDEGRDKDQDEEIVEEDVYVPRQETADVTEEQYPYIEDEADYRGSYDTGGKIENAGNVREIRTRISNVDLEFDGLPTGMRSILLASSAVLGLAIFVFLAIFITCKVRKQRSVRKRYANRGRVLHHDVEKSPNTSPTLIHSGYKDMTIERRYYLWNTIRKTLRYK